MKKITGPQARKLIKLAGGSDEFLQYLQLRNTRRQRYQLHNWSARGIPPATILEHYDALKALYERLPQPRRTQAALDAGGAGSTLELV